MASSSSSSGRRRNLKRTLDDDGDEQAAATPRVAAPTRRSLRAKLHRDNNANSNNADASSTATDGITASAAGHRGPKKPSKAKPRPAAADTALGGKAESSTGASSTAVVKEEDGERQARGSPGFWLMKSEPNVFSYDDLCKHDGPAGWDGVRNHVAKVGLSLSHAYGTIPMSTVAPFPPLSLSSYLSFVKTSHFKQEQCPYPDVLVIHRHFTEVTNHLRSMKLGDKAFFYHSNCKEPGIVGLMEIIREASVDDSQFDPKAEYYDAKATEANPRWYLVHCSPIRKLERQIGLAELRTHSGAGGALAQMELFRQTRLSVSPVSASEFQFILSLEEDKPEGKDTD
ncbi:hypothetical protein Dda_8590 [Drechslerella dactyloides]|uniref:EVE domain-containing protein n=1 Tax=Drechslerella dactyloides TaxID=74499 RepID=A0AAD6IQX4_DREDA|nr:hypothetical protein Dda_8590 [Drechslerella dactyloides]